MKRLIRKSERSYVEPETEYQVTFNDETRIIKDKADVFEFISLSLSRLGYSDEEINDIFDEMESTFGYHGNYYEYDKDGISFSIDPEEVSA